MDYDLLVKSGQTVDGMPAEITTKEGGVAAAAVTISGSAKETIHLESSTHVSAGWIDDHVRYFEKMAPYYDYPDEIGAKKGIMIVIDTETTSAENIHEFYDLA